MAQRSSDKHIRRAQSTVPQLKKRPSSCNKAERSKRADPEPRVKSASSPTKNHTDELLAKEEQYKLLNAELEAKTASLVRQAEQLMREHDEALSRPLSFVQLADIEDEGELEIVKPQQLSAQEPEGKAVTRKKVTISSQNTGKQVEKDARSKTTKPAVSHGVDLAAAEESASGFLAETIRTMEEKMDGSTAPWSAVDDAPHTGDNVASGVSDAQIRVLKAKLRIMQEELDQLTCEYYKKDDENAKLAAKIKEVEEDRARLQKTTSVQQTQIEKHRALAEESGRKSDGLQLQVSALHKEIENLNRSQKQAAATHGTVEVRLNRALEEVEKLKTQLSKTQQRNKDKISEDHQSKENLLAENKMLKKQKAELILGFKKQLRLIDVLKRQKMHLEAARLLSFTEEEFVKALDWGKS